MSFLKRCAAEILSKESDLQKISIVLPSRRAAVFLRKELSQQIQKPVFAPHITTIEDFLMDTLEWEQADRPTLVFKLFESYCETVPEPRDDFATFSQWAPLLLADFNEIDRHLVDPSEIFSYLADAERLKNWNLRPPEQMTEMVRNYLKMWESLAAVYFHFYKKCQTGKRVYQGMAYREMAEQLPEFLPALRERFSRLYFLGFNALNTAEENILLELYREKMAHFFWDVDEYYFDDKNQEAGSFLRKSKLVKTLIEKDDFYWKFTDFQDIPKNIKTIAVVGNHLQAVATNRAVLDFQEENLENVAVVLSDENLLRTFLNNLAEEVENLNITMGLPLEGTPAAGFFTLLLEMLQEYENHHRKGADGNPAFHFQKWEDLLANPLCKIWLGDEFSMDEIREKIHTENLIFISENQLFKTKGFGVTIFQNLDEGNISNQFEKLARIAEKIHQKNEAGDLLQALFGFYKIFNRLAELTAEFPYLKDWQTATRFFQDLLRSETLDLYGEPLSGLQVMGMLETRTLDFKNLVIVSLNEGILPKGRSENSLIPFDIKKEFGLPTYLEKDAVFAYHFYRLVQRAENLVFIYNNAADGLDSGEPSRFILQLEHELKTANFQKSNPNFAIEPIEDEVIEKTESVMTRLREWAEKGVSPSALIDYVNDPLQFYRRRVLGLKEADEVEEVAGYDKQGTVAHAILETLFKNEKNPQKIWTADDEIFQLKKEDFRDKVIAELYEEGLQNLSVGKNLLIREILTEMLFNFTQKEKRELESGKELQILGLEKKLESELLVSENLKIKLIGSIDRIDSFDNERRVIDYKTGAVEAKNVYLKEWIELRDSEKNKALQLLCYAWLYFQNNEKANEISAGIFSLRKVGQGFFPLKLMGETQLQRADLEGFEIFLKDLISEIFNAEIPFRKEMDFEIDDE